MSTASSLKERLARREPVRGTRRVPSGTPASYVLRAVIPPFRGPVSAARALVKRGLTLRRAHRIIDRLAAGEAVPVGLPVLDDAAAFEAEMRAADVIAERRAPPAEVDVRAIRERLGCSQDEFALRFGLDAATVRNWEQGRNRPDAATRTLLVLIDRHPEVVEAVLSSP